MNNVGKKVFGGVIAVVAIVSLVNTSAIIKLADTVRSQGEAQKVAYAQPVQQEYYVGNQQAALGTLGAEIVEDEPSGLVIVISYNGNNCTISIIYDSGLTSTDSGSTVYGSNGTPIGCSTLVGGDTLEITSINNQLSVNSSSSALANQLKLVLFGYLTPAQLTGKWDAATQTALKYFQKLNGITQTGTMGPLTNSAFSKAMLYVRGEAITGTRFNFSTGSQGSVKMGPYPVTEIETSVDCSYIPVEGYDPLPGCTWLD